MSSAPLCQGHNQIVSCDCARSCCPNKANREYCRDELTESQWRYTVAFSVICVCVFATIAILAVVVVRQQYLVQRAAKTFNKFEVTPAVKTAGFVAILGFLHSLEYLDGRATMNPLGVEIWSRDVLRVLHRVGQLFLIAAGFEIVVVAVSLVETSSSLFSKDALLAKKAKLQRWANIAVTFLLFFGITNELFGPYFYSERATTLIGSAFFGLPAMFFACACLSYAPKITKVRKQLKGSDAVAVTLRKLSNIIRSTGLIAWVGILTWVISLAVGPSFTAHTVLELVVSVMEMSCSFVLLLILRPGFSKVSKVQPKQAREPEYKPAAPPVVEKPVLDKKSNDVKLAPLS